MERTEIDEELEIMRLKIKLLMSMKYFLYNVHPLNHNYIEYVIFLLAQKYTDNVDNLFVTQLNCNIFSTSTDASVNYEQILKLISTLILQYKKDKYDLLRDLLNAICVDFYY
jgi:hypothetical protein